MNDIFIVCRKGVYIQYIIGAFDDFKKAEDAAVDAIKAEEDDYHIMFIIKTKLNKSMASMWGEKILEIERNDHKWTKKPIGIRVPSQMEIKK